MAYPFVCDITDPVLGLVTIPSFECEVEVSTSIENGELVATCTDVLIKGQSLRGGSELTSKLRIKIMCEADDDLAAAGPLWDRVQAAEGVSFHGAAGDPDGYWQQAAE